MSTLTLYAALDTSKQKSQQWFTTKSLRWLCAKNLMRHGVEKRSGMNPNGCDEGGRTRDVDMLCPD
jgi:hypothetical protein